MLHSAVSGVECCRAGSCLSCSLNKGPIGVWWQRWQLSGFWIDVIRQQSTAEGWHPTSKTRTYAHTLLHSPALHQLFLTSNLTSPPVLHVRCSGVLPPPLLCPSVSLSGKHCRVSFMWSGVDWLQGKWVISKWGLILQPTLVATLSEIHLNTYNSTFIITCNASKFYFKFYCH